MDKAHYHNGKVTVAEIERNHQIRVIVGFDSVGASRTSRKIGNCPVLMLLISQSHALGP
jgi:hypothetical protein